MSRFDTTALDPAEGTVEAIPGLRDDPPDEAKRARLIAMYDGNLAAADHAVGGLIDSLRAYGIWDETIFVLMSDHGQAFFEHGRTGHGGAPHEEQIHVPLMIRVPGAPGLAGRRVAEPVELVDLLPTLLELLAIPRADHALAGRSLWPLVAGEREGARDRAIFSRSNRKRNAVFSIRRGDLKLIFWQTERQKQMFDLAADPGEERNLVQGALPPAGEVLLDRLHEWVNSGDGLGSSAGDLELDVFDEADIERLRSLGYGR